MRASINSIAKTLLLVFLALIGAIIGLVVANMNDAGYFARWHQLPPPPAKVTQLVTVESQGGLALPRIYIKTIANETYSCEDTAHECWVMQAPSFENNPHSRITQPCNYSSPEFSALANPPGNIVDCIQDLEISGGEALGRFTFALDKDGGIWKNSHWSNSLGLVQQAIVFAFFGATVGLVVGYTWLKYSRK